MKVWLEKEIKLIPIIDGSNWEEVEIVWQYKVLDDGYTVMELVDFSPTPKTRIQ